MLLETFNLLFASRILEVLMGMASAKMSRGEFPPLGSGWPYAHENTR
jgi:hypothetical protein